MATEATLLDVMYAAGLFEGEGSISIAKHQLASRGHKHPSYSLDVRVQMCDREPVDWLCDRWGGGVNLSRVDEERTRTHYAWYIAARQAARFLGDIRPFLVSVRLQTKVDLAVAFQAQKRHSITRKVLPKYRGRQTQFYDAMRLFNVKGKVASLETEERLVLLDEVLGGNG